MSDETTPPTPSPEVEPPVDVSGAVNPDDLMSDFKGKPLLRVLFAVFVLHAVVIGVFSFNYLQEQVLGEQDPGLSDAERMDLAVREVSAAIRDIADKHGVNKQDLAGRFESGPLRAAARTDAPPADRASDESAATEDEDTPDSEIEQELDREAAGPQVPDLSGGLEEEDDLFAPDAP